jgi:hypothetical protein
VITSTGEKLKLAPESLRADRGVVLAAVAHHGAALRDAAARLKGDRGVVLAAVAQVRKLCHLSSWAIFQAGPSKFERWPSLKLSKLGHLSWANFSLLWL